MGILAARRPRVAFGRLVALAAALVVCAWFALGIRGVRDQAHVAAFLTSHRTITAIQAKAADATLDDAQFLNPDRSVDGLRVIVEFKAGDHRKAIATAKATAQREPQNVAGWLLLVELAVRIDPATVRLAAARIDALAPPVPR